MIRLKRAYEPEAPSDGYRVLVERLWPRGVRKEDAHLDEWLKAIAPSDALRKWFGHEPSRWDEFQQRYERELHAEAAEELLERLARRAKSGTVTLVYSAHDQEHNNAVVLAQELRRRLGRKKQTTETRRAKPVRRMTGRAATVRR
jgi:uncharacterized protein YeaO (DUF488 family)